jgi:hypothetical protein
VSTRRVALTDRALTNILDAVDLAPGAALDRGVRLCIRYACAGRGAGMDMGPREGGHESQEAFVLSELLNPLRCHPEPPKAAKDLLISDKEEIPRPSASE